MIDLEILRLELNYLIAGVKEVIGKSAAEEIGEAINLLVFCFLNPSSYTSPEIPKEIQLIEEYLCVVQESTEPNEYGIFRSNIVTIETLIDKTKVETSNIFQSDIIVLEKHKAYYPSTILPTPLTLEVP